MPKLIYAQQTWIEVRQWAALTALDASTCPNLKYQKTKLREKDWQIHVNDKICTDHLVSTKTNGKTKNT
ncbi:hypothetical protein KC19_2G261300 [Ceratodon purpureus]|uniref:Uncharacterized protein n=1 Tax=Ceratodon purpureus TaxID=3225 RepID=A0A8T0J0E0_CERPU|nr:hypothetical protein KC19_2G261300 [Ceratodon purpureus]